MAKIIGEPGRLAARQAVKKIKQMFLASSLSIGSMALLAGFSLCLALQAHLLPWQVAFAEIVMFGIIAYWVCQWISRSINHYDQERIRWRKAALGESAVGVILESLPDDCVVFNDLRTVSGNIDHVVIAPTGIFVIDTRNWRGVVTPDGRGELLCNGKTSGRNEVKKLLLSITSLREKINLLTRREDFIQGILAFPLARVEARWGATRNAHCLTDEGIPDYIRKYNFSCRLKKGEIELIEKAFHALSGLESGFDPAEGGLTMLPVSKETQRSSQE